MIYMNSSVKLPVLVYHQIVTDGVSLMEIPVTARPYCLYRSKFIEQLEYLHTKEYKVITVSEVSGLKENNVVAVTFDDGMDSDYFITYPELIKRGFRATFYIVTNYVGKKGYMTWEQIKELKHAGMEIGSHSMSHPYLTDIDRDAILNELIQSKQVLESCLGESIESFGVPFGFVDNDIIKMAFEAGYKTVCTSNVEFVNSSKYPMNYGRFGIRRNNSIKTFKGIVDKKHITIIKIVIKEKFKDLLKRFMGKKTWLVFREKYLKIKSGTSA